MCLAAAYLEPEGDGYRYRYAVLCGGEAAKRALRIAVLDSGGSDEPGPGRRIALATYADFVYRLPNVHRRRHPCRCLSRSVVPPLGHPLAATNARECIGAVMAVPLSRGAPLDDQPAALALKRRELQPDA